MGLLDDVAVIVPSPSHELVVKTDAIVGGVHFLPADPPDLVARKALRVNLSDLAAKGAIPRAYLLDLILPDDVTEAWIAAFAHGLSEDQTEYVVHLIGGDTDRTPGPLTIAVTAFGEIAAGRIIRRAGARAGDTVFVTGSIGDAALGLRVLHGALQGLDVASAAHLVDRYRLPLPRVMLGPQLVGIATASIDVSDGLIADLRQICEVSKLSTVIEAPCIPLSPAARAALAIKPELFTTALTGGDDYEPRARSPNYRDRLPCRSRRSARWRHHHPRPRTAGCCCWIAAADPWNLAPRDGGTSEQRASGHLSLRTPSSSAMAAQDDVGEERCGIENGDGHPSFDPLCDRTHSVDRIKNRDFVDRRLGEALCRLTAKDAVSRGDHHPRRTRLATCLRRANDGAAAADEIIDDYRGASGDLADQCFAPYRAARPMLLDESRRGLSPKHVSQRQPQPLGALSATQIGGDHGNPDLAQPRREMRGEDAVGHDMLRAAAEGILECSEIVHFDRNDGVASDCLEEFRDVFRRHWVARLRPAVLPRIAKIRGDGGDAFGSGILQRSDEKEQPAELVIDAACGIAMGGVDDIDIMSTDVGKRPNLMLTILEVTLFECEKRHLHARARTSSVVARGVNRKEADRMGHRTLLRL